MPAIAGVSAAGADAALELELRGPNHARIPTRWIGLQEIEPISALHDPYEEALEREDTLFPPDDDLLASIEHDWAIISTWDIWKHPDGSNGNSSDDEREPLEKPPVVHYQILLELLHADDTT